MFSQEQKKGRRVFGYPMDHKANSAQVVGSFQPISGILIQNDAKLHNDNEYFMSENNK